MDKRKKYYLILDVETANTIEEPLVYDVGFIIGDKQGKIYEKYSFSVAEMFEHYQDLLSTAYYADKLPSYYQEEQDGTRNRCDLYTIRRLLVFLMNKYNIHEVYAYNVSFDRRALNTTERYFTKSKYRWFFPYGTQFHCIWNMACSTLFQQKTFRKLAEKYNWKTASGKNIATNAETAYKYVTGNFTFIEEHKGIDDVIAEYHILLRILAQHKKTAKEINPRCWATVK